MPQIINLFYPLPPKPQDTMERRNFNVKTAGLDVNDLDASALDDDGKTFTYSYLNYSELPLNL